MAKRLFVGVKIKPASQLNSAYQKLQSKLKDDRIKWVESDNFHLTLKFLGETNEQLLPEIFSELENMLTNFNSFKINIKGIGRFYRKKHSKVIWFGIDDPQNQLYLIAEKLNKNLKPFGFKPEQKTFKAHLTVGRVKYIQNEHVLNDFIDTYSNHVFQEIIVDEVILYERVLKIGGSVYNSLNKVKLKD